MKAVIYIMAKKSGLKKWWMVGLAAAVSVFVIAGCSAEKETTKPSKTQEQKAQPKEEATKTAPVDVEAFKSYAANIKGSPFVKTVSVTDNKGFIEYFGSYTEFKQAKPDTTLTEDMYKSYFDTGDAIQKILVGENVRLLRQFPNLTATSMVLPYGGKTYTIDLGRKEVNDFLGFQVEKLSTTDGSWIKKFSDPYIYDPTNRQKFIDEFVTVK